VFKQNYEKNLIISRYEKLFFRNNIKRWWSNI